MITEDPLFWVVSRDSLIQADNLEIRLPAAGSLAIRCDLPGKSPKQPVMIELRKINGIAWNTDFLRFHFSTFSLANPGETVFEHLPPGQYTVQRFQETKTGSNSVLATGADRQLVTIETAKRTTIRLERRIGQPTFGSGARPRKRRLALRVPDNRHLGPEEVYRYDGEPTRIYVAFDVIPITSEGRFTTDPIPPGKYWSTFSRSGHRLLGCHRNLRTSPVTFFRRTGKG